MTVKEAKRRSNHADFYAALALSRSVHHIHDVGRILTDNLTAFPIEKRQTVAELVREIEELEGKLKNLGGDHSGQN
jgi:hypothetical protein